MPEIVSFKISGGEELARALESKPPAAAKKIIRVALRAAVVPWRDEMVARVRKGWHVFSSALDARGLHARGGHGQGGREREFGVISQNIRVAANIDGSGYAGQAAVFPAKRGFWSIFLEFGTKHARAFPFIRAAFEARKQEVLNRFIDEAREQLRDDLGLQ